MSGLTGCFRGRGNHAATKIFKERPPEAGSEIDDIGHIARRTSAIENPV
jgi:hypothetical protein